MNYKFIELEVKDHIATVTLAREKSLNAVSLELASEITDVFRKLSAMDAVRVVILKSRARIFCAGLDLKDAAGGFTGTTRAPWDMIKKSQPLFDCCNVIEECPKPVIAAVHGQCIGAGLHIISACDIRLCTQDATFCLKEPKIGLCADMGALQRLPLIVGQGYAREIAFTVAFYNAQQVEKMGLSIMSMLIRRRFMRRPVKWLDKSQRTLRWLLNARRRFLISAEVRASAKECLWPFKKTCSCSPQMT